MWHNSIEISNIRNLKLGEESIKNICLKDFISKSITTILLNSIRDNPIAIPREMFLDSILFRFMDRDTDVGFIVNRICDFVDVTHVKLL